MYLLQKRALRIPKSVIGGAVGGIAGGLGGYQIGDTQEQKLENAISLGLSGVILGSIIGADPAYKYRGRTWGQKGYGRKSYNYQKAPPPRSAPTPKWAKGVKTKADAKKRYKQEARKKHPDIGGTTKDFQNLQNEWAAYRSSAGFSKMSSIKYLAFVDELQKIKGYET